MLLTKPYIIYEELAMLSPSVYESFHGLSPVASDALSPGDLADVDLAAAECDSDTPFYHVISPETEEQSTEVATPLLLRGYGIRLSFFMPLLLPQRRSIHGSSTTLNIHIHYDYEAQSRGHSSKSEQVFHIVVPTKVSVT